MTSGDATFGTLPPCVRGPVPGPASRALAERLRAVESRNVTWLGDDFPVFWEEARGANVRDADGNVYVDLTGAFGVAFSGHRDPAVLEAVERQARRLVHGMGDLHPPALKVELLERLARLMPWPEARGVLASTGSEAVEIALKTALLATARPGILAFEGGYHGLTLGALAATGRPDFREPFAGRLYEGTVFVPFPDPLRHGDEAGDRSLEAAARALDRGAPGGDPIGAVIVEPVQGRAGIRVPPPGFMAELGRLARDADALVIADEVFTGLGRAGSVLASHRVGLEPDLVCLGKALGGGLPLSGCFGPDRVMEAWPPSPGEALHTSTFLGHPLACAAALAILDRLEGESLADEAARLGEGVAARLEEALEGEASVGEVRRLGLMIGVELVEDRRGLPPARAQAARVAERALAGGVLLLPGGDAGHVVEITPPVVLTEEQAEAALEITAEAIRGGGR